MHFGRAIALLAASVLVLTACGGGDSAAPIADPSATDPALATAQALSGKAGKVVWSPSAINVTVLQGTETTTSAIVSTGAQIDDVSLFVVPEIAGVFRGSLSGLRQLYAGGQLTVPIWISALATTAPGTYEGTVHIRSGAATVSQTLKVAIRVVAATSDVVPVGVARPSSDRIGENAHGQTLIRDELVVILDEGVSDTTSRIREIAAAARGIIVGSIPNSGVFQIRFVGADPDSLPAIADSLRALSGVKSVSRHFPVQPLGAPYFPTDRLFPLAEWLDDALTATAGGRNRSLEYVHAPEAWQLFLSEPNPQSSIDVTNADVTLQKRIAILDWDFDVGHPDFRGNVIRAFSPEISKDKTFVETTQSFVFYGKRPSFCLGGGHGTSVAGTTCARADNKIGAAGLAGRCELDLYAFPSANVVLRDAKTYVQEARAWAAEANQRMRDAVDKGARIINMSFGAGRTNCRPIDDLSKWNGTRDVCRKEFNRDDYEVISRCPSLQERAKAASEANAILAEAMAHAAATKKDVLWIAAAGNESTDAAFVSPPSIVKTHSTHRNNVIVTAAVDLPGTPATTRLTDRVELSYTSNFGDVVDVAAPVSVTTTIPRLCGSNDPKSCEGETEQGPTSLPNSDELGPYTDTFGGTSAAAPQVAALAALVWKKHPAKTASQVKDCIVNGASAPARPNSDLSNFVLSNILANSGAIPADYKLVEPRFGVINAAKAVKCAPLGMPPSVLFFNWTPRESPTSTTPKIVEGQSITFGVVSEGSDPKTYQWSKNGAPAPGISTGVEYTTPPATLLDDGARYTVTISNAYGSKTSDPPLILKVTPAPPPSEPRIGIVPTSLDFGGQQLGTPSAAKSFSITNTGSAPLIISSVTSEGANAGDFALAPQPCTQAPLAPAGSCSVSVVFTPSALGARSAVLSIVNNAAGAPHSAGLAGTGLDGPPPPPTPGDVQVLIDGLMWTDAIALDGEWVYFGTGIGAGVDNKWVLNRVSRDGTKPQLALATDPVGFPGPGFPRLYKIAFTATKVVVGAMTPTGYTIWSVDKSTWQVQQIVTGVGPLVAAYGDYAYYGGDARSETQFFRISLSNPADVVGVGGSYGYGQLLDPPFLYYGYGSGDLSRLNLDTGVHNYIRSFGSTLYQAMLSGDSDYLYYPQSACSNYGVLWRVSKTPPFATDVLLEGNPITFGVATGAAPAGQYVYYLESNIGCQSGQDYNLRAVSKVDRTVTPVLLSHIGGQYGLMSDGSAIYWYEGGNPSRISKFPKSAK